MNIELQCCGLIMLLVLVGLVAREKSLDISSRRSFKNAMYACIACLLMDIASVICIVNASDGDFSRIVTLAICKIYLVLLIYQSYAALLYASNEFLTKESSRGMRRFYSAVALAGCAGIMLLPIEYYTRGRIVYTYGPSTLAAYAAAAVLILLTIRMAFRGKGSTARRRRRCILIWQGCWITAAIVQFLNPELLLVGFAAAFGIFLVYAELENPHEGVDRVTGMFTSNAMSVYLDDLFENKRDFSALHILLECRNNDVDYMMERRVMRRIGELLDKERRSYVFRFSDNELTAIFETEDQMREEYRLLTESMDKEDDLPVKLHCCLIPDGKVFRSADEFAQFQHYSDEIILAADCMEAGPDEVGEMRAHMKMLDTISWALANDRVEVFYQPIYSVEHKRFTSAEALVRIYGDDGRLVMPGSFIPVAETSGLIIPLGIEVFRQVCDFLASGVPQPLGVEYIEVNLSMAQFDKDNPASFIQQAMNRYSVDPSWINLEITETADANTRQVVLRNMDILRQQGISFSLDDFGTGRSNLDYIVNMPVQIIKFDYQFTHWYFGDDKARNVVEGTASIIRNMGLPIVAEGVENEEQLEAMIKLGASYIQGFYFSKPLSKGRFVDFMRKNQL